MSTVPGTIVRRTGITGQDNPAYQVSAKEWNEPLIVDSVAPDGALLMRDRAQPDGWGFVTQLPNTVGVPSSRTVNAHPLTADVWVTAADVGLPLVENVKLSTWGGSSAIATVGIVTTGTWQGSIIQAPYGGTGTAFAKFTGGTALRTYTMPDMDATIFSSAAPIPVSSGGTGVTTGLTQLNASNLTSGIVPDARLSGNVARRDQPNNVPWNAVSKAGSSLADLEIRSAADLTSGILAPARMPLVSLTAPGAAPTLSGEPTQYLNALGQWTVPAGGTGGSGGSGDVTGPAVAVNNNIAIYSGSSGKVIKDAGLTTAQLIAQAVTAAHADIIPVDLATEVSGVLPAGNLPATVQYKPILLSDLPPLTVGVLPAHHGTHDTGGSDAIVALSGGVITTGTVADARLSANIPLLNKATNTFTGVLVAQGGLGATPLNASNLTSGTVPDAQLSANVALRNASNTFTQDQTISKIRPALELVYTGSTARGRVTALVANDIRITRNVTYDGTNFNLDDTAQTGGMLIVHPTGNLFYQTFTAGANPRTAFTALAIANDGTTTISGNTTVGGVLTVSMANNAYLYMVNNSRPVNERRWSLLNFDGDGSLYFQTMTDAEGFLANVLSISRANVTTVFGSLTVNGLGAGNGGATIGAGNNSGTFTGRLVIKEGTGYYGLEVVGSAALGGKHAGILLNESGMPADQKKWRLYTYDGGFSIERLTDAETGVPVSGLIISAAGGVTLSNTLSVGTSLTVGTSLVTGGSIHTRTGNYVYPGRVDVAADGNIQTSWLLATHGSYGLYTNTGMYFAGAVTIASGGLVVSAGGASITGTLTVNAVNVNAGNLNVLAGILTASNTIASSYGYQTRPGIAGPAGGNVFNFQWNGSVGCWIDATFMGNVAMTSDARLKRDFTPLVGSLDKVRQLRPGAFYYLSANDFPADPMRHLGLLAQDVMAVAPELVRNTGMVTPFTPDGLLQINYLDMIPMLVAAIQELEQEVNRLREDLVG